MTTEQLTFPVSKLPKFSIGETVYKRYGINLVPFYVVGYIVEISPIRTKWQYDLVEAVEDSYEDLEKDYTLHYPVVEATEDEILEVEIKSGDSEKQETRRTKKLKKNGVKLLSNSD